ncbi:MAG: EscU/YscU/HrcU family type III secretion system export apparatus switch protein, partial [Halochromatium sp.]
MAEDQGSDQEKTEEATPRRLEKAREEGQVPRSRELTTFVMLLAGVAGFWLGGALIYDQLGLIMEQAFLFERREAFEVPPMLIKAADLIERS